MHSLLTFASGRRGKYAVVIVWLVIVAAASTAAGKFDKAQKNDPASYLPGKAESVKALQQTRRFPSGASLSAIVVYHRDGGLRAADRAQIGGERARVNAHLPPRTGAASPPLLSRDGTTALLVVPVFTKDNGDVIRRSVDYLRAGTGTRRDGLQVEVTGPAGFSADAVKVFGSINGTLLLATATLVFVLLILIYRSPVFWLIPMFSVGFAETTTRALGYGLTRIGVTVNGQAAGILLVLVFGAGTDYALLLVARYREELRRHEDKHEALAFALRRAGPAIIASGLTVIASLLVLTLAEVNGTAGLGPIGAMGVAMAMLSMLTILPALLAIGGRRAFWPFVPRFGGAGADETHGVWRRVGERVGLRPTRVWVGGLIVLAVMAGGLADLNSNLTSGNGFRGEVDSVKGQKLLSKGFPSGGSAPTNVVVRDPARLDAVRAAITAIPGVAQLGPVERGAPGARFQATLKSDPYSDAAFGRIGPLRDAARRAGGAGTLVGGPTAEERDLRHFAAHDNRRLPPLVLLVVFLILAALLRAILLPLILIGTVVASLAAALGVGSFFFTHVFGFAGEDPSLPLFAFIFLVALGVDYNIFLMARVREEALKRGTRQGMVRGLAVTGGVITSAGVVLAGTFGALAILPLVALTEIGFTIACGVLLDTFIVRSLLVPALVFELGPRVWWPSMLSRSIDRRELFGPDADREDEAAREPVGTARAPRALPARGSPPTPGA